MAGSNGVAVADKLLGPPKTAGYKASVLVAPRIGPQQWGRFSLDLVDEMRTDWQVSQCLQFKEAPLHRAKFTIKGPTPTIRNFVAETLERYWQKSLSTALECVPYGAAPSEVLYKAERGLIKFDSLRPIHPRDGRPFTVRGKLAYIRVASAGHSDMPRHGGVLLEGPAMARPTKGFWATHQPKYNLWFGHPAVMPSWWPWRIKTIPDGAMESIFKAFYKHGFLGLIMRHPSVMYADEAHQTPISAQDFVRQMGEMMKAGMNIALPSERDDKGYHVYEIEKYGGEVTGQFQHLIEYPDWLDRLIARGIGIPDEIIQHQGNTGGYSRSNVAMMAFVIMAQSLLNHHLEQFKDQILTPLVKLNYGRRAWYEIKAEDLMAQMTEQHQPGQPGLPGQGGPPPGQPAGKPPSPFSGQMQPKPPSPFQMSGWTPDDEAKHPRDEEGKWAEKSSSKFRNLADAAAELDSIRNNAASVEPDDDLKARVDAVGKWLAANTKNTGKAAKLLQDAHHLADRLEGGSGKGGNRIEITEKPTRKPRQTKEDKLRAKWQAEADLKRQSMGLPADMTPKGEPTRSDKGLEIGVMKEAASKAADLPNTPDGLPPPVIRLTGDFEKDLYQFGGIDTHYLDDLYSGMNETGLFKGNNEVFRSLDNYVRSAEGKSKAEINKSLDSLDDTFQSAASALDEMGHSKLAEYYAGVGGSLVEAARRHLTGNVEQVEPAAQPKGPSHAATIDSLGTSGHAGGHFVTVHGPMGLPADMTPKASRDEEESKPTHEMDAAEAIKAGMSHGDWQHAVHRAFVDEKINEDHHAYTSLKNTKVTDYIEAKDALGRHVRTPQGHYGKVADVGPDARHVIVEHEDGGKSKHFPDTLHHVAATIAHKLEEASPRDIDYFATILAKQVSEQKKNIFDVMREHGIDPIKGRKFRTAVAEHVSKLKGDESEGGISPEFKAYKERASKPKDQVKEEDKPKKASEPKPVQGLLFSLAQSFLEERR